MIRKLISLVAVALSSVAIAQPCADVDFNNDGVFPSDQDTIDFVNVLAGAECATCDGIDFNGDGVFPDDADYRDWLATRAGGPCSNGGWTPNLTPGPTITVGPGDSLQAAYQSLRWSGGTILLPYSSRPGGVYNETVRWDDQDGMPYGNVAVVGVPSDLGERPTIKPPSTSSAGFRLSAPGISIRGIQIECDHCEAGIDITGGGGTLIEDVVIVGSAIGIRIQGDNTNGGEVRIRRCVITKTRGVVSHSQGIYIAGWKHLVLVEGCVFYDIGEETTFNQCIYSVHGPGERIFTDNWFKDPGFAGIQARGSTGDYTIRNNVFDECGNAIGVGHPMGAAYVVRGIVANNLVMNPKRPFWGIALQNGDGVLVTGNFLLSNGGGYAFQIENPSRSIVVKGNTISRWEKVRNYARGVSATTDGIDWQGDEVAAKQAPAVNWQALLSRRAGVWVEATHGTGATIEMARQEARLIERWTMR